MSLNEKQDEQQEEPVIYTYTVAVKFEQAGKPYSFGTENSAIKKGDYVVVETQQGLELGLVEADALEVAKYSLRMPTRPVLRIATPHDLRNYEDNRSANDLAFDICNEEIKELGLGMNLLSAQYTLDRAKILFVYLAEQRVDFRELLKHLGAKLHCRIELRQIGERDKAKMIGGIGTCGMECCCRRFKSKFDIISINMAKNQLLALNIDKLSGMCGKLMCCLKYEDNDYKEMTEGLPKMGSQVEYDGNIYRITSMNVMSKEAKLENREQVLFITLDDLRTKAIPRKGVVMAKKTTEDGKPVRQTVVRTTASHADTPAHNDTPHEHHHNHEHRREEKPSGKTEVRSFSKQRQTPKPNANTEVRSFSRKNRNGAEEQREAARRERRQNRSLSETANKNVTVRTFSRKKKEAEEAK